MGVIVVGSIVFRKNKESYEFLLLKRVEEQGGFWQYVIGKLENEDESLLDGCFREIKEEVSIDKSDILNVIEDVHCFEMDKHYLTGEPIDIIKEYVFGFEVDLKVKPTLDNALELEHKEIKWVNYETALKLLRWQNNKDAFVKLYHMLQN